MILLFVFLGMLIFTLSGCTAGQNELVGLSNEAGDVANFWLGLWHGIISPITLVISIFNSGISVYEVHNTGFGYNAGFVIGIALLGSSASGTKTIYKYTTDEYLDGVEKEG